MEVYVMGWKTTYFKFLRAWAVCQFGSVWIGDRNASQCIKVGLQIIKVGLQIKLSFMGIDIVFDFKILVESLINSGLTIQTCQNWGLTNSVYQNWSITVKDDSKFEVFPRILILENR